MVDKKTKKPLSPFYPPHPRLLRKIRAVWEVHRHEIGDEAARAMPLPDIPRWQLEGDFEAVAVSRPGVVPQGYLSRHLAKRACENAGKRLCTRDEWLTACQGAKQTKFPYGTTFSRPKCNVYRYEHPAFILHGDSSVGHRDPRLNLVLEAGKDPVLRVTGGTATCSSEWDDGAAYDMVGNLDEWIADERGVFVGGFYARATTKGCKSRISSHAPSYFDYSTGTRCCKDAARGKP